MAEIGHNGGPTFDDIARENQGQYNLLIAIRDCIVQAVRDPRLEPRHLKVLVEVIDCLNASTGTAYPGRKAIAERMKRYDVPGHPSFGYSESGIGKTISELIAFGYLVSVQRAPEGGGRALAHYTIKRPTQEELQTFVAEYIENFRKARRPHPRAAERASGVTSQRNTQGNATSGHNATSGSNTSTPGVTSGRNTSPSGVTSGSDVTAQCDVTSGVTLGGATVTSKGTREGERENPAGADASSGWQSPPLPAWPTSQPKAPAPVEAPAQVARTTPPPLPTPAEHGPREGENHVGHGVYMNGETIRHAAFVISLPGIRMNTIAAGLTANEVTERCLAHALQWAAEIENGMPAREAVPGKVANFLARSIMGDASQAAVTQVRMQKARDGYSRKPASVVDPGVTGETDAERMARLLKEMDGKR